MIRFSSVKIGFDPDGICYGEVKSGQHFYSTVCFFFIIFFSVSWIFFRRNSLFQLKLLTFAAIFHFWNLLDSSIRISMSNAPVTEAVGHPVNSIRIPFQTQQSIQTWSHLLRLKRNPYTIQNTNWTHWARAEENRISEKKMQCWHAQQVAFFAGACIKKDNVW